MTHIVGLAANATEIETGDPKVPQISNLYLKHKRPCQMAPHSNALCRKVQNNIWTKALHRT